MTAKTEMEASSDRPHYNRNPGEAVIFFDIYDAESTQPDKFGSRQFFLVTLREKFTQIIKKTELFKLKAYFGKRKLLEDVTIEYIGENCTCIVCPYNLKGLTKLQRDYDSGRLNRYFIDCLVTEAVMKKMEVRNLKLKIKLWADELETIREEWRSGIMPAHYELNKNEKSMRMLRMVKKFQLEYLQNPTNGIVQKMRDAESRFEHHMTDIITYIKRTRVGGLEPIKGFQEVCKLAEENRKQQPDSTDLKLLMDYINTIRSISKAFQHVESNISYLILQIRVGGESDTQMERKEQILKLLNDAKESLKDDALFSVKLQQYVSKITQSERVIFQGFVSYLPHAVQRLVDLDEAIDEYLQSGNAIVKATDA